MKSKIQQYLMEMTDRLIFINLREEGIENLAMEPLRNIEIPVFSTVISAFDSIEKKGISSLDMARAMMYILGIDEDFRYNIQYVEFIKNFTDSPLNFSKELIMTAYKNNNLLDSIIYTRAYINGFSEDEEFIFNYGALCEEYSAQIQEEAKKEAFYQESQLILAPFIQDKIEQATELIEEDELEKAEKLLNEVLKKSPENFEANFYLGYIKRIRGEFEKALDFYEKAYHLDNQIPRLVNEMGICFSFLGDFEQALELFLYASSLDENSGEILCNISMVYLNLEDMDNARKYANMAFDLNPDDEIAQACFKEIRKYE